MKGQFILKLEFGFLILGSIFFSIPTYHVSKHFKMHQIVPEEDYQIMITDPFYRETIAFAKHRSIANSRYKFIYIPTRDGVIYELYDRIADPLNKTNIAE